MSIKKKVELSLPKDYKNKKFILFIICPQKGNSIGGSDAHVLDLSCDLLKHSEYTPLVLFPHNERYRDRLKENDIPYIFTHGCRRKIQIVRCIKKMPKQINIVCIHSHQYDANYLTQELIMFGGKTWKNIPVVMTCHGWIENSLKLRIMTYFDFKSYKYSNTLIAVSKKDEKRLLMKIPSKTIRYIPNGVRERIKYSSEQIKNIKKKYGIGEDKIVVSYIGRLSPEKRIDLVIEAANKVCKKNNKIDFLIAGNGSDLTKMNRLIEKYKLSNNVHYVGFVKEIDEIESITDIILITSDTEGTPRALIETMQYGAIPVCTNVGGINDILGDNIGFKCLPNNVESISNGILKATALDDKSKKQMRNSITKLAKDEFSIRKMSEKIIEVYKEIEG